MPLRLHIERRSASMVELLVLIVAVAGCCLLLAYDHLRSRL